METIASHWARKKITTVREAYDTAKSEHKKYQKWADEKQNKTAKTTNRRVNTSGRKEMIPEWMDDKKKKEPAAQTEDIAERARRLKEQIQGGTQQGGEKQ